MHFVAEAVRHENSITIGQSAYRSKIYNSVLILNDKRVIQEKGEIVVMMVHDHLILALRNSGRIQIVLDLGWTHS